MPAFVCLVNKFHRSPLYAKIQIENRKKSRSDLRISFLMISVLLDSMIHRWLLLTHSSKTGCAWWFNRDFNFFFTKRNEGGECKTLKARKFCFFPLYSPDGLSLQRKKLDLSEAASSWQGHADAFISHHPLSTLVNCFVSNHGGKDIMLISESWKEHKIVCFPLLSFDEGLWVLWV